MDIQKESGKSNKNKRDLSMEIIEISSQQEEEDQLVEIALQRSEENQKNLINLLSQNNFQKAILQNKIIEEKEIIHNSQSQDSDIQILNFSRKVNLITFNDKITKRQINILKKTSFFLKLSESKRWVNSMFKKLNDRNWIEMLPQIQKLQILHFQGKIYFTSQLLTLNPFYHIKFTKLTVLDLSRNKLKSIQQLYFIHVPYLKTLNLRNNLITNVKILNKLKFSEIRNINLDENVIRQIQYGKMKLNRYEMRKFQLAQKVKRGQWIREKCGRDLSKFLKCQARCFTSIFVQPGICQVYKKQPKIRQQLQKKYNQGISEANIYF